ncbi:MAG: cytochrome c maturation protein CcmE [Rubrivivax sp.]|nr:cytochrome c maturation protein CcmE [Rubrivivax sp.]
MKARHRRLALAGVLLLGLGAAAALVLDAFRSNLVFFYSPTQVLAQEAPAQRSFRLGGLVERGSVRRDGLRVDFVVTDTAHAVPVSYEGILPDLFQEGKGVVVQGRLDGPRFVAREVLAKHDENYMPPEAGDAVRRAGESRAALAGASR